MFKKFGLTVIELDRIKMGDLSLDKSLDFGECRYITPKELELLKK
jgi:16S rRNA U516 pseudouridylate synthase RsuA-like enzyme